MRFFSVIGYSLVILSISIISFFLRSPISMEDVNQYIAQSETILLNDIQFIGESKSVTYHTRWRAHKSKYYNKEVQLAYSPSLNKYFSLENYDIPLTSFPVDRKKIYLRIHTPDMKNSHYGHKENPIIVLLFYTDPKYSNYYISGPSSDFINRHHDEYLALIKDRRNGYTMVAKDLTVAPQNIQYLKNVHEYLTYERDYPVRRNILIILLSPFVILYIYSYFRDLYKTHKEKYRHGKKQSASQKIINMKFRKKK